MPILHNLNILELLLASHSHFLENIMIRPSSRQERNTREHARAVHPAEISNVSMEGATTSIKRQTTAGETTTTADIMAPSTVDPKAEAEATTSLGISPKTKAQIFHHPHLSISQTLRRTLAGPRMCRPRLVMAAAAHPVVTAMTYTSSVNPRQRREGGSLRYKWSHRR